MAKTKFPGPNTYDGFDAWLGRKDRRKLSHNVYAERVGGAIEIIFHWTAILVYRPNGEVSLTSGGYQSVTTKVNLNQYSDIGVWQEKRVWYAQQGLADKLEFEDGMRFSVEPSTKFRAGRCPDCGDQITVAIDFGGFIYCPDCFTERELI